MGKPSAPSQDPSPLPLSSSHRHLHPLSRRLPPAFKHLQKLHLSISGLPSNCLLPLASKLLETFLPVCTFSPHPPLKPPNHTLTKTKVMVLCKHASSSPSARMPCSGDSLLSETLCDLMLSCSSASHPLPPLTPQSSFWTLSISLDSTYWRVSGISSCASIHSLLGVNGSLRPKRLKLEPGVSPGYPPDVPILYLLSLAKQGWWSAPLWPAVNLSPWRSRVCTAPL